MIRIVAGSHKGMRLVVPRGDKTRPTADRVRESLFNILGERVVGALVLDLFAGSGALGIEALSRGARGALFIDQEALSVAAIRRNLTHTSLEGCAQVVRARLPRARSVESRGPFDLIFLDPPYNRDLVAESLKWIDEASLCALGGRVVVEHSIKEELPDDLQNLKPLRQRHFGETALTIFSAEQSGGKGES